MLGKNIEQINHARLAGKEGLWRIKIGRASCRERV